jgi:Flp pilus assembly protein TadD
MSLIAALLVAVSYVHYRSEVHTMAVVRAHAAGDWSKVIFQAPRARSAFQSLDAASAPIAWYEGIALHQLEQNREATSRFEEALQAHPNHPQVLNSLAGMRELQGRRHEAVQLYEKAVTIAPRFSAAWLNLATVYYAGGEVEHAEHALDRVEEGYESSRVDHLRRLIDAANR